jgi:TolB-like protein
MEKDNILQSWKEISNYLERDTRTCLRWESELGLPVYRIDKDSLRSKVFAYKSEIDQWHKKRATLNGIKKLSFFENRRAVIGLITFLALLSVTFAVLFFSNLTLKPSPPPLLTIAVFPFENSNSSESDEYFIEGITNGIANKLALLTRIKVIPISSLSNHTNPPIDLALASQELNTDYVLRGYIEINNNRVKIGVQLINAESNQEVWNEEYDNKLEDIFYIQEDLCKKILKVLNISPNEKIYSSLNNGETRNYKAYDYYLKGNYIPNYLNGSILNSSDGNNNDPWKLYIEGRSYMDRFTQKSNDQAIMLFEKAIEYDSRFSLAYIGLASCYSNYINFDWDYNIKWLNLAEELLEKAQSIDPDLVQYYTTSIEINLIKEVGFSENTKKITRELIEEGINKHPYDPQLISIIGSYYFLKFGEEGNEADFEKAIKCKRTIYMNDQLRIANFNYAELLMLKKDFIDAIHVCEIIDRFNPSYWVKSRLGEILYYAGELEKSRAIFREMENIDIDFKIDSLLFLSMIAAQSGEREKALKLIEQIHLLSPQNKIIGTELFRFASVYFVLRMKESGYKNLRVFFENPVTKKMHYIFLKYIDIDKNFDSVRDEEEFKTIIK